MAILVIVAGSLYFLNSKISSVFAQSCFDCGASNYDIHCFDGTSSLAYRDASCPYPYEHQYYSATNNTSAVTCWVQPDGNQICDKTCTPGTYGSVCPNPLPTFSPTPGVGIPTATTAPCPPGGCGTVFTPTPTSRTPLTPTSGPGPTSPPAPTSPPSGGNSCSSCTVVNGGPTNSSTCGGSQYLYVNTTGYSAGQCGTACLTCPAGTTRSSTGCGCVSSAPVESGYTPPACGGPTSCCGCPGGGAYVCTYYPTGYNACLPDAWGCGGVPACNPPPPGPVESSYESSYEAAYQSYYESYYQPAYKSFLKTEGGDIHSGQ